MVLYPLRRLFRWSRACNDDMRRYLYVDKKTVHILKLDNESAQRRLDIEEQLAKLLGEDVKLTGKILQKQTIQPSRKEVEVIDVWGELPILKEDEDKVAVK